LEIKVGAFLKIDNLKVEWVIVDGNHRFITLTQLYPELEIFGSVVSSETEEDAMSSDEFSIILQVC